MAIVYKHYTKDNGILFYVGMGLNEKRAYSKRSRNWRWKDIAQSHGYYVEIYLKDVDIEYAKMVEVELIHKYGRVDLNNGILCNMTDGGDYKGFSSETRRRISTSLMGKTQSEETKKKRSESSKVTWQSTELRELKRRQTTDLIKRGILSKKGIPSPKKGKPFDGDKVKLSKSLKKHYETAKVHNFKYLDRDIIVGILTDYSTNGINKFQLHKKYNLNRKIIDRVIKDEKIY